MQKFLENQYKLFELIGEIMKGCESTHKNHQI